MFQMRANIVAMGVIGALLAAWWPARDAAKISPLEALSRHVAELEAYRSGARALLRGRQIRRRPDQQSRQAVQR